MTTPTVKIHIRDWTRYPGGRFKATGDYSGEEFRQTFLEQAVTNGANFEIDFNGIFTVDWSFLDEALGHFVSQLGEKEFRDRFKIISDDDPDIEPELETVIERRRTMKP